MSQDRILDLNPKCHIVFLHNKFRKKSGDRYVIDLALGLKEYGHKVTIMTSALDTSNCFPEVYPTHGVLDVKYSASYLPSNWYCLKALLMALRVCLFPPKPRPEVVILDTHTVALFIFSKFSRYRTILLTHFSAIKELDFFTNYLKVTPDLFTATTIPYASEILVETDCLGEIFKRSFPNVEKELRYITPCVDTGLWKDDCIDIHRIIPDLPANANLFAVFGPYKKRSNFRLALEAMENLMFTSEESLRDKFHLIIGGNCNETNTDELVYYDELIDIAKEKQFGSQVTFVRQLPIVYQKTVLKKCAALLITAKHDPFPNVIVSALMMGKPIIATNSGFCKKALTHRINGILLDSDPQKFAAAMHKIVTNPMVQMFISEMASDLFRKEYSFDCVARKINGLVQKQITNACLKKPSPI
ncbi:putative alpha-1,3 1,6-mannosyltransferase [Trypoxylus dichotomus]